MRLIRLILVDLSLMLLAPQKAEAINIGASAHFNFGYQHCGAIGLPAARPY
ncbi:hypothetical protein ACVIGA_005636 [Bradyrhizobium sp. USDA 3240]